MAQPSQACIACVANCGGGLSKIKYFVKEFVFWAQRLRYQQSLARGDVGATGQAIFDFEWLPASGWAKDSLAQPGLA